MAQPYWGARGLKFGWVEDQYMSRLSTKNYKPRATGSLRHCMLKVFCAVLKTAPFRLNYSILFFKRLRRSGSHIMFVYLIIAIAVKWHVFKHLNAFTGGSDTCLVIFVQKSKSKICDLRRELGLIVVTQTPGPDNWGESNKGRHQGPPVS